VGRISLKHSGPYVNPDIIHYTTLLQALGNAPSNNALQMAQNVLKKVEKLSGLNDFILGEQEYGRTGSDSCSRWDGLQNTVLYCLLRYVQVREDIGGRVHNSV
jgi:hypothetical protein